MRKWRFVRHNHAIFDPDEVVYANINPDKTTVLVVFRNNPQTLDLVFDSAGQAAEFVNTIFKEGNK